MKVKVTNITTGFRGIHDAGGFLIMIDPGKSEVVDLSDDEARDAEKGEWFKLSEPDGAKEGGPNDITAAIDLLDAAEDKDWTNAGLPAVDAISALVGRTVTRAEINEAAPDFMRPAVE